MKEGILRGAFSLDGGVLLELLLSTKIGKPVFNALTSDSIVAYTSYVNLSEARYILCRKLGRELAWSKTDSLLSSNYITVVETDKLHDLAADIKCIRRLALADCYCLAVAERTGSKALFAFAEQEVLKEISTKPFDIEIVFLENIAKENTVG